MPPNPSYNPYEILGIQKGCSDKALKDAYKLQCLKWHPDKNPNNKEEAERKFIAAKEAFQFLFDKEKRAEYDKGIDRQRAKEAKQAERLRKADTERKRFINELERREKEFSERGKDYKPSKTAEESNAKYEEKRRKDEESRVRAEFEKLRKQLEKEVAEEMRAQQERMAHPVQHTQQEHDDCPKLRLKWTPGSAGEDYDETQLRLIFHEYGAISEVTTIFTNKKGVRMCIVEFEKGADCWGAETESGAGGPEIQAVWVTKPRESAGPTEPRPDDSSADTKPSGPVTDFATMSFEELQAQILGDMGPPIEKKKKWHEDEE